MFNSTLEGCHLKMDCSFEFHFTTLCFADWYFQKYECVFIKNKFYLQILFKTFYGNKKTKQCETEISMVIYTLHYSHDIPSSLF